MSNTMQPTLQNVRCLFTDIDDTMSTHGKIAQEAYDALWRAHHAGLAIVPVTGRPAGWCDHIARMWPVDGVIGENGGLYMRMTGKGLQRVFRYDDATRAGFRQRLEQIREEVLAKVPGCGIASDQPYREYDLAIDFCEDVKPLSIPNSFNLNMLSCVASSVVVFLSQYMYRGMVYFLIAEINRDSLTITYPLS